MASRADSDEHYVLDPCDEVLGVVVRRQQRLDWLRGDPSAQRPTVRSSPSTGTGRSWGSIPILATRSTCIDTGHAFGR